MDDDEPDTHTVPATDARITDEPCARCKGLGETQGYADNNVPCGACAGTGKRIEFTDAQGQQLRVAK